MADIRKGEIFIDQQRLAAQRLNNLFDAAVVLPTFITGKAQDNSPDPLSDLLVVYKGSIRQLRRLRLEKLPSYATQPNPAFITLSVAGSTSYPLVKEKASQNATCTLTLNTTLFMHPFGQDSDGMQGALLVRQDATGGRSLTLMHHPHHTVFNQIPGQPPSAEPVLAPIGVAANEYTMLNWTYITPIFSWTAVKYGA